MMNSSTTGTTKDPFPAYRVRPRFQMETDLTLQTVNERLQAGLTRAMGSIIGKVHPQYASFRLPPEEQHYWSPQLSLSYDETEAGCQIRGMYGPRPAVWTMFVFFYAMIGFGVLVIAIVGLTQLMFDEPGQILWLVPILVLVFFSLYWVAYLGQRLGHDQMVILHHFLESSLEVSIK